MRRQLKAFRTVCSSHGNVGFPPKPRRVVASGFSDSFDHPSSIWEEMAASGKPVSILRHVGPSIIMKMKPFPPNIYCCTHVFVVLRGTSGCSVGRKPYGHRGAGHTQDATMSRFLSRRHMGQMTPQPHSREGQVGMVVVVITILVVIQITSMLQNTKGSS